MFSDTIPKTRSGKIVRRVLKAVTLQQDIGNIMTFANPEVVEALIERCKELGEIKF